MSLDHLQFETIIGAARYFPINVIAFAADSQSAVLSYGADEQYILWDVPAQSHRGTLPWTGSNSYCGQMNDHIGYIMARYESTATTLYQWLPDGTLSRLSVRLPAAQRVTLAPGGEQLVLWQADNSCALYTLSGKRLLIWQAGYYNPQFTPDGKLVAASQQQQIDLWDAVTGAPLAALRPAAASTHQDWFFSCSFITNSHLCCIWSRDRQCDMQVLDITPVIAGQPLRDNAPLVSLHGAGFGAPAATPVGHSLIIPTQRGWEEWEWATGRKLRESLVQHAYTTIRFAANADYFIACHEQEGAFALFSYADARLLSHIMAHDWNQSIVSAVTSWQWSPDSQWLITTGFMEGKSVENWVEHGLTERWEQVPLPIDVAQQDFGWTASLGLVAKLWHITL